MRAGGCGDAGLQVIDVADPTHPILAASYDTPGDALGVFVHDEYVYVADSASLIILRFDVPTGIEEGAGAPGPLAMDQNHPNPFNATTSIDLDLAAAGEVDLAVYDILGRRVATLLAGEQSPGSLSLLWNAGEIPSGIYFARLETGSHTESIAMTLVK